MSLLSKNNINPPNELIQLATTLGADSEITQGPGGNISVKVQNVLWIKASGTQLANANTQEIFVPIDLNDARHKINNNSENYEVMYSILNLRPSIETAMHAIIEAPYVAHVHALNSSTISSLLNAENFLDRSKKVCRISYVPYVKPGIQLAKSIEKSLEKNTSAVLLGNHGLTVWGETPQNCLDLIDKLEESWSSYLPIRINTNMNDWIRIILEGAIFPDELVFFGFDSFTNNFKARTILDLLTEKGKAIVKEKPWLKDYLVILEKVSKSGATVAEVRYLTSHECNELLNWESEKFRRRIE
jgi:ribulose-5-phosphate 4-epimerase/fuculose-1-phosphate aldolase